MVSFEQARAEILGWVSGTLKVPPEQIDLDKPLDTIGLDSLDAVHMIATIETLIGEEVPEEFVRQVQVPERHVRAAEAEVARGGLTGPASEFDPFDGRPHRDHRAGCRIAGWDRRPRFLGGAVPWAVGRFAGERAGHHRPAA
jgi:acyl carrier protein